MKRFGKLITLVLVVAMALSLMSVAALAAGSSDYKDVVAGKWYVQYVDWALENEFMTGISDTEWAPNTATTRGMVIQTLYKMAGAPEVEGDSPFADVAEGKYYTNAVKWAVKAGVASGKSTDSFKPDDVLTRQEAATFFCAFAKNVWELDVSDVSGMNKFPDNADVANYAKDAMGWAVKANVISGSKENDKVLLMPKRDITRAELAAMLKALNKLVPAPKPTESVAPVAYETADVVINLTSDDEKEDVSGVAFVLVGTDKNGNPVSTQGKTDKNGKLVFKNVVVSGEDPYQLIEKGFDTSKYFVEGYDVNVLDVDVVGPTTDVAINHEFINEKLTVTVTSEEVRTTLEGLKVVVSGTSETGKEVSKWSTTNRDGIAKFNLPASDKKGYKVEVVELPDYYETPKTATAVIANNRKDGKDIINTATVNLTVKKSAWKVQLVNEKGEALNIGNVKLTISGRTAAGTRVRLSSEVTNVNGTAFFAEVPYSDENGYSMTAVESPEIKDYEYEVVAVMADAADKGTIKYVLTKAVKGTIEVTKVDENGEPLEGAKFVLLKGDEQIGKEAESNEDGIVTFKNLDEAEKNVYVVKETSAPVGYKVAEPVKVGAVKNKEVTKVTVKDAYKTGSATIQVLDTFGNPVPGVHVYMKGAAEFGWPENEDSEFTHRSSKATDDQGMIWFDKDEIVTSSDFGYEVVVTDVPRGYVQVPTTNYVIEEGDNGVKIIYLDPIVMNIKVKVVHADDANHALKDVNVTLTGYDVVDPKTKIELEQKSKDKGIAEFSGLYVSTEKGYSIGVKDDSYKLVGDPVVVTEDEDVTITIKVTEKSDAPSAETDTQPANK